MRCFNLRSLAFATLLLTLLALPARAQEPCTPDCQFTPFGPSQFVVVTLPGGCKVLVEYTQRHACNTWYDVGIVNMTPLNTACAGINVSTLVNQVTNQLLVDNPMGFPPDSVGECETNWRVIKGACWRYDTTECDEITAVPCGDGCCLQPYEVCIDRDGNRVVTSGPPIIIAPCGPTTEAGCEFICGGGGGLESPLLGMWPRTTPETNERAKSAPTPLRATAQP